MSCVSGGLLGFRLIILWIDVAHHTALALSTECNAALGFENGNITDDQLSASSRWQAQQARLNVGDGWNVYQNGTEYLKVDLLTQHRVTGFSVQGSKPGPFPKSVYIFYSQDSLAWKRYVTSSGAQELEGPPDSQTVLKHELKPTIQARYLAYLPTHRIYGYNVGLRLELYGCEAEEQISVRHTVVSQDIEDTEEWLPSQSPYVINSVIYIRPSGHVTIQPGVNVIFNSHNAGLVVLGTLEAVGFSRVPVVFTASSSFTNRTSMWSGLEVVSEGNLTMEFSNVYGAVAGIKGSLASITLRHCHIHHNYRGLDLLLGDTNQTRVQLSGTIVSDNSREGIYGRYWDGGSNFIGMKDCDILRNGDVGLTFDREVVLFAENCRISHNRHYGIYHYYNGGMGTMIKGCTFENNGLSGFALDIARYGTQMNMTFLDSYFTENQNSGLFLDVRNPLSDMQISIINCHFTNNIHNGVHIKANLLKTVPTIVLRGNTLEGTKTASPYTLMRLQCHSTEIPAKVFIEDNIFSKRSALYTDITSRNGSNAIISGNWFINCSTTSVIHTKNAGVEIHNNVFLNPHARYDVFVDVSFAENQWLNASHNFWGSSDKFFVRSRICDFFCDVSKLMAEVHPFYVSQLLSDVSPEVDSHMFSYNETENTLGGILNDSITFPPNELLYVNRNLFIPVGMQLTIKENTTLVFPNKHGIVVKGILATRGKVDGRVELRGDSTDSLQLWSGIFIYATGSSLEHTILRQATTGISLFTERSGMLVLTDITVTQCTHSIRGRFWSDFVLSLERVQMNDSDRGLYLDALGVGTVSVAIGHSSIHVVRFAIDLQSRTGQFNVSLYSSHLASAWTVLRIVCLSNVTMSLHDSKIEHVNNHDSLDVSARLLNIHLRRINVEGLTSLTTTTQQLPDSYQGTIEIQDSIFSCDCYRHVLDAGNTYDYATVHAHDVLLVNNTFQTQNGDVYLSVPRYSLPWGLILEQNMFNCSLNMRGNIGNASIKENTFQFPMSAMTIHVQRTDDGFTEIAGNVFNGGSVSLESGRDGEGFAVQNNHFNRTTVVLKTPTVTLNNNSFLNGTGRDVKFEGSGYKGLEINCTHNFWGTTDVKEISRRIYDWSYDETLPKIQFIPLYRFSNLTDLQYPARTFVAADGRIGGSIGGTVTLTYAASPYTVTDNIVVGKLETLIVEAGVTLRFMNGVGIVVEGALKINGNKSYPVKAVPANLGEKWSGVQLFGHIYRTQTTYSNVRLVGGKAGNEGRLELRINDTWGTVCDRGYGRNYAAVICRMLGYDHTIRHERLLYGFDKGTGPIHLGNLRCTGSEETVSECTQPTFSCDHSTDVGIRCNGEHLSTTTEVGNDVQVSHFHMNDTRMGLVISGNISSMNNIVSTYSQGHGVTFNKKGLHTPHIIDGLNVSNSGLSGITVAPDNRGYDYDIPVISISNCYIAENGKHGIHIQASASSNISLMNCTFHRHNLDSISLDSAATVDISQTLFLINKKGILRIHDFYSKYGKKVNFCLRDSHILQHDVNRAWWNYNSESDTSMFAIQSHSYIKDYHFEFVNNIFHRSIGNVFYFNMPQNGISILVNIRNNTFTGNNGSIVWFQPPYDKAFSFSFVDNIMINNTALSSTKPLLKLIYQSHGSGSQVDISQNTFSNNRADQIIYLGDRRKLESITGITRNAFQNNLCSNTLVTSVFQLKLRDNVFSDPSATCEVKAPSFDRWDDIDARWNYWGSQEMDYVMDRICGFDIDFEKGFVHYLPYYLTGLLTDVSSNTQEDFWLDKAIGGVIVGQIRLQKLGSPYRIRRSIFIRSEGCLIIDSGVQLDFQPNTGIYVDGVLLTKGVSPESVTLTGATNMSWFGVVLPYKTGVVSKTVRLVNGSKDNEGRVELFVNETWSTLRNLRPNEAVLVCQALGYGSPELTIKDNGAFGHGQGPIIQNLQCDSIARSLLECQPSYCTSCSHKHDVGIICNQFVGPTGIHPNSYLERVSILDSKRGLVVQTPTVRLSNCHINNTEGAGLTIQTDFIELDLNGTVVEHGQSTGIFTETRKGLHIFNGTTQHNIGSGIQLSGELVDATVEKMNILNNNLHGIETTFVKYYTDRKTQISVKQNNFESDTMKGIALKLKLDRYYTNIEVLVEKNIFRSNAVSVDVSMMPYYYNTGSCVIKHNRFLSSGPITIDALLVSFEGNTARDSPGGENCFLTLDVNHWYSLTKHQVVSVFTNSFNNISGKCVVLLKSSDNEFNGTFNYNQISNSTSKEAAVMLNSKHFNFHGNLFDNPISDYELKVLKTGEDEVKAEHNWWGSTDPFIVNQRILHKDHVKMLLKVDYLPLLTYQKFDCLGVNNCSDKGVCVRPNGCRCDSGWGGADCSDFDCSDVSNCNRNGVCMGPNQCNCSLGWEGATCVLATCHEVNDCGGNQRGYCVLPEKCTCFPDYSGDDCMQCAQSRWGESCLPCPRCNHGSCNVTNGMCHCIGENWSGELCDTCTETFYGPACLPYINVLNIIPRSGPDTGGRDVHIWGHNFPETGNNIFLCRFDTIVVNGTRLSKEHIVCKHPQHPAGVISVEISPDGEHFTTNQTRFTFYEVCPPGACGKTETPPHGHCLYGGCVCLLPWSGRNCSVELKAPIISLSAQTEVVAEGDAFSLQPVLSQGSVPIDWYLSGAPSEMTIELSTGRILWERAVANVQPLNITVRASNYIGHSEAQLSLTVKLSYNVTIDVLTPRGVLTVPKAIQIKGHVTFFSANRQSSIVFVDVKIRNKDKTKSLLVLTSSTDQGHFETLYYPMAGDSGQFDVDGRHPADTGFSRQTSWSVLGMKCVPGYVSRQAYLDTEVVEMPDITSLKNDGVDPISNISITVEGAGGPLSSAVVRTGNMASANTSIIAFLNRGEDTSIDLVLTASSPLRGTIAIVFSTPDGTTARVTVGLQLNVRKPFLVLSPTSLSESVPRRTQKTFQINIKNEGEVSAKSLRVAMPSESRLAMSAFSSETTLDSADGLDLQPNETAILILTFTTGAADSLGQFTGSVALNSDLSSASIPFTFYVTSQETLNITVRVEDEYTYFATGKPLVSGAVVTLQNPRRGYRQKRTTTNQTEFVVFEDASEDRYSLTASAPGHGSYSAVIIAKPSDSSFTIFLQRVAVKYTWTVTPTTFEDKYIVTLESTYETQVPMPVVTVEPAKVNIIPYETGVRNVINFNVTNHGLIRADNVRFILPSHSTLVFTQNIDPIGFLEANTSIIVQVSVSLKTRVKRSLVGCALKMLYDAFCGGIRTGGQDITLTRELPGRPPLPCRRGESGTGSNGYLNPSATDGRGSGGSSITSLSGGSTAHPTITPMEYNPVTPLTCDCLSALVKDCLLPFVPGGSCLAAMFDVDLEGLEGFFPHVMTIIKLAKACAMKRLSVKGMLKQLIKCLYEAVKHCPSQRRRRDTDGEVTQGVVNRNTALRNYMVMSEEVFGHENPFDVYDNSWGNSFNLALADDSAGGSSLSSSEIASIVSPLNSTRGQLVEKFLLRWNKTMTAWEDGTLASLGQTDGTISYNVIMSRFEQFKTDTQNAKQRGFDSIFEDFDNAVDVFQEKEKQKNGKDDGICAKVRVRIVQELVLTRDAFNARLEIENGEQSSLDNIRVTVNIRATYGDASSTIDKFSVGSPTLNGLTGVDGTGRLETEVSGSAEWLIIPYSTAAVREDTLYDVGGILSYTVDGSNFTIHLLPDTITVKPNPSLTINYFHEKYVQGDDPMTSEVVEPIVPFTLAVMVTNGAYGIAKQLKITSAQPEIIENERGLLISFKIIGAQLETKPVRPSLSIDFGDIESFETKTARWLLTSSLRGKFYNFTATFENINPLGDPQLSIMEHVGYHELVHLVRLESTKDVRDDFLVNDVIDEDELPEVVYDSSNGFVSAAVLPTTVKTFSLEMTMTVGTRSYSFVNLSVIFGNMSDTNYTYTRLVNNVTRESVNETLLEVTRHDGKSILVGPNAWQTSHYHDKFYLHIFDHHRNIPETASASYSLVFGPKNIHKPMFKQDGYQVFVYSGEQPGPILKVQAVDEDHDTVLRYMLMESSLFAIHQQSGQIRSLEPLQTGLYNLSVTVTDDGVPAFSASVHVLVEVGVNITVTSDRTLGTTPTTFSPGDRIMPSVSTEWLILPSINGPMDSPFSTEKATVSFSPSQKQQFLSNSIKESTLSLASINGPESLSSPIERSTPSEGRTFAPASFITPKPSMLSTEWGASRPIPTKESTFSLVSNEWLSLSSMSLPERPTSILISNAVPTSFPSGWQTVPPVSIDEPVLTDWQASSSVSTEGLAASLVFDERSTSFEEQTFPSISYNEPVSTQWQAFPPSPTDGLTSSNETLTSIEEQTIPPVSIDVAMSSLFSNEGPTSLSFSTERLASIEEFIVPTVSIREPTSSSLVTKWQTFPSTSFNEPVSTEWQALASASTDGLTPSNETLTSFEEQTFPPVSIEGSMTSLFSKEGSRTQVPVSSIIPTVGLISSSVIPKESISLGPSSSTLSPQASSPGTTSGSRRNTCINFIYMQVMFVSLYSLVYSYAMCIILC